jgi:hypothetical protein
MDSCNVIVARIDLNLRRHLGQAVDARRLMTDKRYALDLLLVCDAMTDTELPGLAQQFRDATKFVVQRWKQAHASLFNVELQAARPLRSR